MYRNPALIAPVGPDGLPKPINPYNLQKAFEVIQNYKPGFLRRCFQRICSFWTDRELKRL